MMILNYQMMILIVPIALLKKNYVPDDNDFEPDKFSQAELSNLVRDLSLSRDKPELLVSKLHEKNLLRDVYVSWG